MSSRNHRWAVSGKTILSLAPAAATPVLRSGIARWKFPGVPGREGDAIAGVADGGQAVGMNVDVFGIGQGDLESP